jgi:SH3-like domain-containing protein
MARSAWLLAALVLGVFGCAATEPVRVEAPVVERATFFYVAKVELSLKSAPEDAASDAATVALNDRVQQLERRGSWFLVRTDDGRQGWANDRDLGLRPVSELFVRRWGVRLRTAQGEKSKIVSRLRQNDRVQLVDKDPQGWAKVTVARTGETGWLEMRDLSTDQVVVRVRRAKPGEAGPAAAEAAEMPPEAAPAPETAAPAPATPPKAAEAAPPPAKTAPATRRAKPGMFEPF